MTSEFSVEVLDKIYINPETPEGKLFDLNSYFI
jgi:hypothetical protein